MEEKVSLLVLRHVCGEDRGRRRVEENLITRSVVWWRIEYPLPFQWKGEESHGKKSVPEKRKRSKRIFGVFAFGFVVVFFI
jgi:hypothetical protein